MQKRSYQAKDIGSILHEDIYGPPANVPKTLKPAYVSKHIPATRPEKVTFTQLTENVEPLIATWPEINDTAYAMTMDNFRLFVANYNPMIKAANLEIAKYNAAVTQLKSDGLNEVQKQFSKIFLLRNKNEQVKAYNKLALEFNNDRGMVIPQRKHTTLKYAATVYMQNLVYLYKLQLEKRTNMYRQLGITEAMPVCQLELNTHHLANLKRKGEFSLDMCKKTLRNYKNRFEEAGIFVDYLFRGNKLSVKMHISSHILVVFDAFTGNLTQTDNQTFRLRLGKELPHNNEDTRTIKSNINKRENGESDFLDLGTPSAVVPFVFYRNTKSQEVESKIDIPQQNVKVPSIFYRNTKSQEVESKIDIARQNVSVSSNLSDKFQRSILNNQDFAQKLAAGDFNNHQRIDKRYFYKEARNGTINREDFKTLIIQEFFKNAAKLYLGKTPYVGSWKKAINSYEEKLFVVNNGSFSLYNKELMTDKLDEFLWRLNTAHKWFTKTGVSPLFPSDYFDFTRTSKSEIGFEYTRNSWKNHLKYLETKPKLALSVKKKALIRKKNIDHSKKFERKLSDNYNNKLSEDDLIDFVANNLPANYLKKLPESVARHRANRMLETKI